MDLNYTSQSRLHFDVDKVLSIGANEIFCFPGFGTNDWFARLDIFEKRVAQIYERKKEIEAKYPGMKVHVWGDTVGHPEGTSELPAPLVQQVDIYGKSRMGYACVMDENWQADCINRYKIIARYPFEKVFLDDDFKDGLCFCDVHAKKFSEYINQQITAQYLRDLFLKEYPTRDEIALKKKFYEFKRDNLLNFARRLEREIHSINKEIRIGQGVSAKRFNDLSGRRFNELLEILNTSDAPSFVRLAGEYYTTLTMDVIQSIGWHLYYDEIIDKQFDRVAEVTLGCVYPKNPTQVSQEVKAHHSFGLEKIHFTTPEYWHHIGAWAVIANDKDYYEKFRNLEINNRKLLGLSVVSMENKAEYFSVDEVLNCEAIRGYQLLELLGFPCVMRSKINPSDEFTYLAGPIPFDCAPEIVESLKRGAHILLDLRAAECLLAMEVPVELKRFTVGGFLERVQKENLVRTGESSFDIGNILSGRIKKLTPTDDKVDVISEIFDVNEGFISYGALQFPALKGRLTILAYNVPLIKSKMQTAFYRKFFKQILSPHIEGKLPCVEGALGVCPFYCLNGSSGWIVLVNVNDHTVSFKLHLPGKDTAYIDAITGRKIDPDDMKMDYLGVKVIEQSK